MKTFVFLVSLLSVSLILSGCQTAAERQQVMENRDHQKCISMGGGNKNYWRCRQFILQQRQIQQARNERQGQMLMDLGNRISKCGLSGQYC